MSKQNMSKQNMSKQNKILVVGATGTVGSALVKALVKAGEKVNAGTRDPSQNLGEGVTPVRYDYDEPAGFDAALEGVDRIFYLSRGADPEAESVAKPLFEKAKAAGVKHIVNMSAMGVDSDDNIPMRQVELLLQKSGVPYTLLRPNFFMQNFSGNYIEMIREQSGIFLPAGDAAISFIDVRDIAAVALKALTEDSHVGKAYNLTGGQALSHREVAEQISTASGKKISYTAISEDDMRSTLNGQGMPDHVVAFMLGLYAAVRAGYSAPVSTSVDDVLGQAPRTLGAFTQEFAATF